MPLEMKKLIQTIGTPSLQNQVIAMLQSVGGSLWVADPAYLFIDSGGTGVPIAGDAIGYAKDIVDGRNMSQATTAAKPIIDRVPTKLGAELVVNGDFAAGTSGWLGNGGTISVVDGQLVLTSTGAAFSARCQYTSAIPTEIGKKYRVTAMYVAGANGGLRVGTTAGQLDLGIKTGTVGQTIELIFTATTTTSFVSITGSTTSGTSTTFDNVTVREVLEEKWALRFDGVNDVLSTASLPASTAETVIVAGSFNVDKSNRNIVSKRTALEGMFIRKDNTDVTRGFYGDAATMTSSTLKNTENGDYSIYGQVSTVGSVKGRLNGVEVFSANRNYASAAAPLLLGNDVPSGNWLNGSVVGVVYAPVALTDSQSLLVERYLGALSGVTIP